MWLQERVEMTRHSLSYHLFWWRLDRLPFMRRSLLRLDPHVIARLAAEGRIGPEEAEALRSLRAAVEAYAAELRWGWARLHSVPQYVKAAEEEFERARQRMAQETEKGLADFRRFAEEFQRRYEVLRRYFSDPSGLDEGERAKRAEEAKRAVERLEEALRHFAAVVSGAIGGDGYVSAAMEEVGLASGERAIALLWRAALAAYGIEAKVRGEKKFDVVASGGDAVRLACLYFLYGPPLLEGGDDRLKNHKLAEAVELGAKGALNVGWEGPRRTKGGLVAADLTISEGDVDVKFNVYLREKAIVLQFRSTDRNRAELAARLLRRAGVTAEVRKAGNRDVWYVYATTDSLAAGRKELRDALAEIVREALVRGWVDAGRAERWLEKLEGGITLKEGWPKYYVGLSGSGALEVKYQSTNPDNIAREARRLEAMGLVKGEHFSVKKPEKGRYGYVSILKEGLAYAAWLSVHGSGDQQKLAAEFVGHILQRAGEKGGAVYEKALEVVEEGRARGSLKLEGFEKEVDGRLVKIVGGGAQFERGGSGKTLLRIRITAEVNGVKSEYAITYGRYGADNAARGRAYARADAPGGREADAERLSALVKALTGKRPRVRRMKNGEIMIECYEGHLDGFKRYAELADAVEKWLEETSR
jgi:diphthamide synthase (EF-2-diphthine--ammonia ligase)